MIQDTTSNATSSNPTNRRQKSWDLLDQSALTQAKQQKQYSTHQTGRILFKTQRSFSVPTAKETKSNEEAEPKNILSLIMILRTPKSLSWKLMALAKPILV
ncbi:hypothetical protein K0M31_001940 [Melipona bicolor]|uniref:Uncharacterized protein n=1 Tax=Melipona bicolor TaxID=60889 RepID=A0AA40GGL8_9HYME|nr:hypothetical protein K0M31_001940 [Melipona bicolor]